MDVQEAQHTVQFNMKLILYFSTCLTYSYKFRLIFAPKQIHRVHFSYMLESCWIILKQTKTHIEASRQCRLISWCCCCSAYCTQPLQQKPGFVWVGRVHVYAYVVYNRCEKKPSRVQEDKYVEQSYRQSRAIDIFRASLCSISFRHFSIVCYQ